MGNGSGSSAPSCGDYSNHGSFGKAFNAAHSQHGSGKTFTWNNKSFTTNCADGKEYRTGPTSTFTYDKGAGTFSKAGSNASTSAHSGAPGFWNEATTNLGPTPSGKYKVSSVTYDANKGVPRRANLTPVGHDAKGRTALQVHKPSDNPIKAALKMDSRGCIVTNGADQVKVGDVVNVTK